MASAPWTVQNIPALLRNEPMTVLLPASMTPEATNRCRQSTWEQSCPLEILTEPRTARLSQQNPS
jgi:hypothetical protein